MSQQDLAAGKPAVDGPAGWVPGRTMRASMRTRQAPEGLRPALQAALLFILLIAGLGALVTLAIFFRG